MPWVALPFGDTRCNRTAFGFLVDHEWVPLHDPASAVDLMTRDRFFAHVGEVSFGGSAAHLLAAKLVPVAIAHRPTWWSHCPGRGRRCSGQAVFVGC